jgi:hypothetical protein
MLERLYDLSSLDVSCVQSYYKHLATPLFYLFQYNHPEKIGAAHHVFSFAPGKTTDGRFLFSAGVPIDCTINKPHPIFSDCPDDIQRMRWWGGPSLLIPENPDRDITVLANYPKKEFSTDEKTRIYAWRYIGGITGLISGFVKALHYVKKHKKDFNQVLKYTYYFAGDWIQTSKIIDLDSSDKACMTSEIYPNENKARIVLCTPHLEYMVWWDGRIEEVKNDQFHCIASGFHQWKDIQLSSSTAEKDLLHTWWIVRRIVAWAAKISDDDLPPRDGISITSEVKKYISNDLFWDGTMESQINNI